MNDTGVMDADRQYRKMQAALKAALPFVIDSRDLLYEAVCRSDGTVPDEMDRRELKRHDTVIDQCQAAIAESAAENRQRR